MFAELPLPPHYDPERVGAVWRVAYQQRAQDAEGWARQHGLAPAAVDRLRLVLLVIDAQNTFCLPDSELFVAGRSGTGAVEDSRRLCEFLYRNLGAITAVVPTLDTHQLMHLFHGICLVNEHGQHPAPFTLVSLADIEQGRWRFNPAAAAALGLEAGYAQAHLRHYAASLQAGGKYALTVWPYHSMLGGIGHALVAALEEAIFFHGVARCAQPDFRIKGREPLTEHYSVLGPEVATGPDGRAIGVRDRSLVDKLLAFDAVVIAGQAQSHCVAWTVDDLLSEIHARDEGLAGKVYLLEDCTSPVVIPGLIDYTEEAEVAFARFAAAGMHRVRSTDPLDRWPGLARRLAG